MIKRVCGAAVGLVLALSLILNPARAAGEMVSPSGLLALSSGELVIADLHHRALWSAGREGALTRLAGREGIRDVNGLPLGGYNDGAPLQAAFQTPWAVAPYRDGYAVTDTENHVLRYVTGSSVTTLAGSGQAGNADGSGTGATFDGPTGLCTGPDGCLYVADTGNNSIRRVDADGSVTTYVGGEAGCTQGSLAQTRFYEPTGLFYLAGALYVADAGNNRLCKIDLESGTVTALAGGGPGEEGDGFQDGTASKALFSHPQGIAVSGGRVYVADTGNGAVRLIEHGRVTTLIEKGTGAGGLYPTAPRALAISDRTLYVGDVFSKLIFTLDMAPVTAGQPVAFTDVRPKSWYGPAVTEVSALGLMGSVGGGRFAPAGAFSRAMCVTVLSRMALGSPQGTATFPDVVPGTYYEPAAVWAAEQGLVQGVGGKFLPDCAVTRAELAAFLHRYASVTGLNTSGRGDLSRFDDGTAVPNWAREALEWCVDAGLISGKPGNLLAPADTVTRAEMAVFLQRYLLVYPV